MKMYPAFKEVFLETAEEDGWLDEWGQRRDVEKAKEIARALKLNNVPAKVIVSSTKLTLQEVEAL